MQPGATWDFIQKASGHALKSSVDQRIDMRHSRAEIMHVVHKLTRLNAISIREAKQIVRVEVSAVEQGRNKSMCVHREKVKE